MRINLSNIKFLSGMMQHNNVMRSFKVLITLKMTLSSKSTNASLAADLFFSDKTFLVPFFSIYVTFYVTFCLVNTVSQKQTLNYIIQLGKSH